MLSLKVKMMRLTKLVYILLLLHRLPLISPNVPNVIIISRKYDKKEDMEVKWLIVTQ